MGIYMVGYMGWYGWSCGWLCGWLVDWLIYAKLCWFLVELWLNYVDLLLIYDDLWWFMIHVDVHSHEWKDHWAWKPETRFHGDYMGFSMAFNGHINDGIDLTNNDFHNGLFFGMYWDFHWYTMGITECVELHSVELPFCSQLNGKRTNAMAI